LTASATARTVDVGETPNGDTSMNNTSLATMALLLATALPAGAAEPVNMLGAWKGMVTVAHIGANPYRVAEGTGPQLPENPIEFTYTITEQKGNRFAGKSSGGNYSETIIGAIQPDGKGGIMLDDDGQYILTLQGPNTMDVCYSHSFPTSRVVGCWTLTRAQ
jgi:hypothetical protein